MNLIDTLKILGIDNSFVEYIEPGWKDSMSCMPERMDFMEPENIRTNMNFCGMSEEYFEGLKNTAELIKGNSALSAIAWHCRWQLYDARMVGKFDDWPDSGLFPELYLLVALAMVPLVRKKHSDMGIEEEVTRDTCRQVDCFCGNYLHAYKKPGIISKQLYWLCHYVDGTLFRLGRMEYKFKDVIDFGKAYRNKETGEVIALAPHGIRYNGKGFVDGAGEIFDNGFSWESSFRETEYAAIGNPVSPRGFALRKEIELPLDKWECVIKEGDVFLDMHIPSGGGMKPEACIDSMKKAVEFFGKHFPEKKTKAIMCRSWIFNTQFEEKMQDSNLSKFMRELYLFPIQSSGREGFFFVFCREYDDLSKAPRDTSLQRAMLDILEKEPLRASGMFILNDDLKYFGSQHYREQEKNWRDLY